MNWLQTLALLILSLAPTARAEGPEMKETSQPINSFGTNLYRAVRQSPGNLFLSPASLSFALGMTSAGAGGETADAMAKVLAPGLPPGQIHQSLNQIKESWDQISAQGSVELSLANALWVQRGLPLRSEFQTIASTLYKAEVSSVDFSTNYDQERHRINNWVSENTNHKIEDLIPPGVLDSLTRLVLTNAIYFKGKWTLPFNPDSTRQESFFVTQDKSTIVPMMSRRASLKYWAGDDVQVVSLPYEGANLSMIVILPSGATGLQPVEDSLDASRLDRWLAAMAPSDVDLRLPRFRVESQFSLKQPLESLGMAVAFDPDRADFSGITTAEKLHITAVLHKAFVEVNEEGTEAAAASAVVMGRKMAAPREPVLFRADHPFLFLIRDDQNGCILFLGRLVNPNA